MVDQLGEFFREHTLCHLYGLIEACRDALALLLVKSRIEVLEVIRWLDAGVFPFDSEKIAHGFRVILGIKEPTETDGGLLSDRGIVVREVGNRAGQLRAKLRHLGIEFGDLLLTQEPDARFREGQRRVFPEGPDSGAERGQDLVYLVLGIDELLRCADGIITGPEGIGGFMGPIHVKLILTAAALTRSSCAALLFVVFSDMVDSPLH